MCVGWGIRTCVYGDFPAPYCIHAPCGAHALLLLGTPAHRIPIGACDPSSGECPWPFIFLHDIRGGLKQEHLAKNLALVAVVAGIAYKLLM